MPQQHSDGKSLLPVLKREGRVERNALFWHYPHYHGSRWTPGAAVRAGDWKLVEFYDKRKIELYNLKDDIGEKNNLAEKYPEKTRELLNKLHQWQKSVNAQHPVPNPDYEKKRAIKENSGEEEK
jgi:hypothetical protein